MCFIYPMLRHQRNAASQKHAKRSSNKQPQSLTSPICSKDPNIPQSKWLRAVHPPPLPHLRVPSSSWWDPHSPGLVVLCRLPLFRNGDLGLGFPCSLLAEEEEVEDDIFPAVLLWLLKQNESELELVAGQRGSRTHTGPGGAPLQRRLLLPADSESTVTLHPHEL